MKILSFGSSNIDYVYNVPHFVRAGETLDTEGLVRFAGGKGLNQAIAIAKSGAEVYHAGLIGPDGEFLRETLNAAGVYTKFLKTTETATGHTIIQVDSLGENSILLYGGANRQITKNFVDEVLSQFNENDIIVLQNEISELEYIINQGFKRKMQIILNPSPISKEIMDINFNKIQTLILNELEACEISGKTTPEEIRKYFADSYPELCVVLTLGKRGSIYFSGNTDPVFCPAFSVNAIDTTCAGDTFTGYFVNSLTKGIKISKALRISSAAAAITVSRRGAAASIPTMDEVKKALSSLKASGTNNGDEQLRQKVINYIKKNINTANLPELSNILGYSKTYTATWVKKHFGSTFTELLQQNRSETAAQLLRSTDLSIEEIIKLCGYENATFFRKVFKGRYMKSPLEYRKFYTKGYKNE